MTLLGVPVNPRLLLAAAALAGALWWALEGVLLFLRYRRVEAVVISRTYTDAEQARDRREHPWDRIRNLDPHSLKATVRDTLRVRYHVAGRAYEKTIETGRYRGQRASPIRVVWYDPDHPDQVLRNGPESSFWVAAGALIVAGMIMGIF